MAAPTLDGHITGNGAWGQDTSFTLPNLVTTKTNDVIIVCAGYETDHSLGVAPAITSITSSPSLTWAKRGTHEFTDVNGNFIVQDIWWAFSAAIQSGLAITLHTSVQIDDGAVVAFAVNGAGSTSAPFDTNASLPAFTAANSGTPTIPFSTTAASALVFQFSMSAYAIATTSSWSQIAQDQNAGGINNAFINVFSEGVTSAQSGASSTMTPSGTTNPISFALDAIAGPSSGVTVALTGAAVGIGVGVGLMNFTGSAASPPPPPPPGGNPSLQFNEAANSQYIILGVV